MTNNFEDFEQPGLEPGNGLPQPTGVRANLAHAWRTRPLFKLLVVMIIAGAIFVVGMSLFSGPKTGDMTRLPSTPGGVQQRPGGPASPYYTEQINKADAERADKAFQTGSSAITTPVGRNTSINELEAQPPKSDPLVELRTQLDQLKRKVDQPQQQAQQPAKPEPFDDSLTQAMQRQMRQLQEFWEPKGLKQVSGVRGEEKKQATTTPVMGSGIDDGSGSADMNASGMGTANSKKFATPIINAGTVSYAQMLTEANSDAPGPILAQILSGPLAGARAVGEFKVENEFLVLKFTLANLKGIDYRIDAIALDPNTTLGAMATEVDERLFTRVILPAAASFISTFGTSLGQPPTTVVTNGDSTIISQSGHSLSQGIYAGIGSAGNTMGQFFQNQANMTQTLIRVAAGTPMGLFFTATVCAGVGCPLDMPEPQGRANNNNTYNNGNSAGLVGTTSSQAGFYPSGGSNGNNNGQPMGTGLTYNNGPNQNSSPSNPPPPPPYNPANQTNQNSQPNGGLSISSGTPGIGTGVFNP